MKSLGHLIRAVYFITLMYLLHKKEKRKSAIIFNIWTFIITASFIFIIGTYYADTQDLYNLSMGFCANVIVGLFDASLFATYILIAILIYSYIRWISKKKQAAIPNSPDYGPEFPAKFTEYLKQRFF